MPVSGLVRRAIKAHGLSMTYTVTITSTTGERNTYTCGGASDQEALIYAGKVVEEKADTSDPDASVTITRDGKEIGPAASVAEMTRKAV